MRDVVDGLARCPHNAIVGGETRDRILFCAFRTAYSVATSSKSKFLSIFFFV